MCTIFPRQDVLRTERGLSVPVNKGSIEGLLIHSKTPSVFGLCLGGVCTPQCRSYVVKSPVER